jgi:heme-degrading monooxygenase HmoA
MWRCVASAESAVAYFEFFNRRVRPDLEQLKGFHGVTLLKRAVGNDMEIVVITEWESTQAIRQFAGDDMEVAVVEPDARALLIECDSHVRHFEIVSG